MKFKATIWLDIDGDSTPVEISCESRDASYTDEFGVVEAFEPDESDFEIESQDFDDEEMRAMIKDEIEQLNKSGGVKWS